MLCNVMAVLHSSIFSVSQIEASEALLKEMQETCTSQVAALEAQLDHLRTENDALYKATVLARSEI